jgi:hypothetical protein
MVLGAASGALVIALSAASQSQLMPTLLVVVEQPLGPDSWKTPAPDPPWKRRCAED